MKKVILFILLLLPIIGCSKKEEILPSESMLIYMAGYNSLSRDVTNNINDILTSVPINSQKSIYLMTTNYSEYKTPTLYLVERTGMGKATLKVIESYPDINMASKDMLVQTLKRISEIPFTKLTDVVLWSHATSWLPSTSYSSIPRASLRSYGEDTRFPGTTINIEYIKEALLPYKLNSIIFDCCLMGAMEVGYELKDCARYIIAAPSEVYSIGFPYSELMELYCKKITREVSIEIAERFHKYYQGWPGSEGSTIAVYDCSMTEELASVAKDIISRYGAADDYLAANSIVKYDRTVMRFATDMKHYLDKIIDLRGGGNETDKRRVSDAINKYVVVYKGTNTFLNMDIQNGCGIAMYVERPLDFLSMDWVNHYYRNLSWYKRVYGK